MNKKVQQLIGAFLQRANALTAANYLEALKDFAHFRRTTVEDALDGLLRSGYGPANAAVSRYRATMLGSRDKSGGLVRGRGLGSSTVNLRLTVLRSFVKRARKAGLVSWEIDVPSVASEDIKDNRGPGIGMVRSILDGARKLPTPERERAYAILRLLSEVGTRRKEIVGLDIDDFDPDDGAISILAKGRTQKRRVPISEECVKAIQEWLRVRPAPRAGNPLFTNFIPGRIGRISGPAVYMLVRGLSDPIVNQSRGSKRLRRVSPHKLRHSAFTNAAANAQKLGLSREAVQKFTGHRDARSVSRYIDAADDVAKKLAKANAAALR